MITLILPVKNEDGISSFLYRLHEVLESIPENYEILVIRGDKEKLNNPLPLLPHQTELKCYGDSLERAILLGFSSAKGDKICVCDADGSHSPEHIPEMYQRLKDYDMVVGSRFLPESKFHQTKVRKIVSWFFVKYANFLGSVLSDPMSGFFCFNKKILENIEFKPFVWKLCLEIELKTSCRIKEIPIIFKNRTSGLSKADMSIGAKIFLDLLRDKI